MPNNIAFNRVAQQLQAQVSGVDDSGNSQILKTDSNGRLQVVIPASETVTTRLLSGVTDSIKLSSVLFSETGTTFVVSDSAAILQQDNSEQKTYSFYVYNYGNNTVTCNLQVSPTTVDSYFVDDRSIGEVPVGPNEKYVFFTNEFMKYTQLFYDTGGLTCTFDAYYNAQV